MPRADAAKEAARDARARAWRFILDAHERRHQARSASAGEATGGQSASKPVHKERRLP